MAKIPGRRDVNKTPGLDMSPTYSPRLGDMLRPNPGGSVTLLRKSGDYRSHVAVVTWLDDEIPNPVRRAIRADDPKVVSRPLPGSPPPYDALCRRRA